MKKSANWVDLTGASADDREGTDFYPTPPDVTKVLMKRLALPAGTKIWEPACGRGDMSEVLIKCGMNVVSTDLNDRGYASGTAGVDFLTQPAPLGCEWIITNPPFSLASGFVERCLTHQLPFALLLKSQYWHAASRLQLFMRHPPAAVFPLTWRPDFLEGRKGGSPNMECLWTVWGRQQGAHTIYEPLQRPPRPYLPVEMEMGLLL